MGDAIGPGYSEVGGTDINVSVDGAEKIDDDKPREGKDEVDIVVREK